MPKARILLMFLIAYLIWISYFHSMSIITITTPFNIDLEFKIAAFYKRLAAWAIDVMAICIYYYLAIKLFHPVFSGDQVRGTAAQIFVVIIPVLIYQLVFELFLNGQTLGKIVAGIKVIDKEGKEPTWGQYITRWILCIGNLYVYILPYFISQMIFYSFSQGLIAIIFFMILYVPDFISVLISSKSQRIGDFAADTVVIDKSYKSSITDTIYLAIENKDYQPLYPQVMRLTDRDINGIRNLLSTKRPSKDTEHYIVDVAQKIKSVLSIESDMHAMDFLQQLLQDYNYFTAK